MPYQSKMISWNQDYFAGLKEIGESYASRADYKHFSEYCLLKERGLKKAANSESVKFVAHMSGLPLSRRREMVAELAEISCIKPRVHSLINHPIQMHMSATFKAWVKDEPNSLSANKFYAYFGGGEASLEAALGIDPDDQISLVRLSYWKLDDVEFMVHHLDEGVFLGDEGRARGKLARVAAMIEKVQNQTTRDHLSKEYSSYVSMLNAWEEYKQSKHTKSFPEWTSEKGLNFWFSKKFYY